MTEGRISASALFRIIGPVSSHIIYLSLLPGPFASIHDLRLPTTGAASLHTLSEHHDYLLWGFLRGLYLLGAQQPPPICT